MPSFNSSFQTYYAKAGGELASKSLVLTHRMGGIELCTTQYLADFSFTAPSTLNMATLKKYRILFGKYKFQPLTIVNEKGNRCLIIDVMRPLDDWVPFHGRHSYSKTMNFPLQRGR